MFLSNYKSNQEVKEVKQVKTGATEVEKSKLESQVKRDQGRPRIC